MKQWKRKVLSAALVLTLIFSFGVTAPAFAAGEGQGSTTGTASTFNEDDNPMKISTPEDVKALRDYMATGTFATLHKTVKEPRTAVLMNDIDLTGFDLGSYTKFNGWMISFDGQGHTISGFSDAFYGLFGDNLTYSWDTSSGKNVQAPTIIKNLHLDVNVKRVDDASTSRNTLYGLLANKVQGALKTDQVQIINCVVSGSLDVDIRSNSTITRTYGAMFGQSSGAYTGWSPVRDCMTMVEMTVNNESEQIATLFGIGKNTGRLDNCLSLSTLKASGSGECAINGLTVSSNKNVATDMLTNTSFYNSELITGETANTAGARTTAELKNAAAYGESWSADSWNIADGRYPVLKTFAGSAESVDLTPLTEKLKEAKAITNDGGRYTPESYQVLQDAIKASEAGLETVDPLLKDYVTSQTAKLQQAMDGLVEQGAWKEAWDALKAAIAKTAEVPTDKVYTKSTKTAYDNALGAAKRVDGTTSADDLKALTQKLTEAQAALTENADFTAFNAVFDSAPREGEKYTSDSYTPYTEIWQEAAVLIRKNNADARDDIPTTEQDKIDAMTEKLAKAISQLVERADSNGLETALREYEWYDETDYSAGSWTGFKTALDAAKGIDTANVPLTDQAVLDKAAADLTAAANKLVDIEDWSALQAALKAAEGVVNDNYTTNSWNVFENARSAAKGIDDADTTTQAVAGAAKALTDAQAALVKKADSTALNSAIAEADKLKEADYTSASWPAFAEALANARAVDQNNATQAAVDAAREGLELAQSRLIEKTSFAGLNEAIQAAEALKEADYTKDSWKAADVAAALAEAKAIEQDPENTPQADVDAAVQKLADAMEQLVKKGDPKALDEAVKSAEALKAEDYTTSTWTALQAVLAEAKVLDRDNADQTAVNTQTEKLVAAMDALVKAADKAALTEACDAAEAKDSGIYTQATYATLQTALAEAKTVLDNGDAAQQEVDKALEGLNKALAGLIKVEKAEAEGYQVTAEIPDNAELSVTKQDEQKTEAAQKNIRKEYQDAELLALFDINLGDYQLGTGESVKITIALPEAAWGYDSYKVYHEKEDGSIEYLDTVYDAASHTLTFTADSFSDFGVVGFKNASADNPDGNSGSNANGAGGGSSQNGSGTAQGRGTGTGVSTGITADSPSAALAAAALLAAAGLAAFLVYRRKTTK